MAKLRLGVIGAGSWTVSSHLPNLERHRDEIEFTIVNRRDPELLARIAEQVTASRRRRPTGTTSSPSGRTSSSSAARRASTTSRPRPPSRPARTSCARSRSRIDPADAWDLVDDRQADRPPAVHRLRLELPSDGHRGPPADARGRRHRRDRARRAPHGLGDARAPVARPAPTRRRRRSRSRRPRRGHAGRPRAAATARPSSPTCWASRCG